MERYLYRGVNPTQHQANNGKLEPKSIGSPFKCAVSWGDGGKWGDGGTWGKSETNAVIRHQRDSSKYPSAGVSTTPSFENAKSYATHNGKYPSGYVYKIDTALLEENGVRAYPVNEYAVEPAIPDDKEVILVADNFGVLPDEIVVKTMVL